MKSPTLTITAALIFFVACALAIIVSYPMEPLNAETDTPKKKVVLYYFYGSGCPNCERAFPIIEGMVKKHSLELKKYEIWYNEKNRALFVGMATKINKEPKGVPAVIIGNDLYIGYSDIKGLEGTIQKYLQ